MKKMKANDGFNVQDVESPFLVGKIMLKGPKSARTLIKQLLLLEEQEKVRSKSHMKCTNIKVCVCPA